LLDRDFGAEIVEDLQAAGNAFEERGYRVISYYVDNYYAPRGASGAADTPEEALNEYVDEMKELDATKITWFPTDPILRLFLDGFEEDVEDVVNHVLREATGQIRLTDPISDTEDLEYIEILYKPRVNDNVFGFEGGRTGEGTYQNDLKQILEEEGLQVENQN